MALRAVICGATLAMAATPTLAQTQIEPQTKRPPTSSNGPRVAPAKLGGVRPLPPPVGRWATQVAPIAASFETSIAESVFFISSRAIERNSATGPVFGNAYSKRLFYGSCDISIPLRHTIGRIERPGKLPGDSESVDRHFVARGRRVASSGDDFMRQVSDALRDSTTRSLIFYVHGFNNDFDGTCLRASQIKHDIGWNGPIVAFMWPSQGGLSNYLADAANLEQSSSYIIGSLVNVARLSGAARVHVIGHSMGSRAVLDAIRKINERRSRSFFADDRFPDATRAYGVLGRVIVAAPDVDRDLFDDQIAPELDLRDGRVIVYAAGNDRALLVSRGLTGRPRLGLIDDEGVYGHDNIESIDVTGVNNSENGHAYVSQSPWVLADYKALFAPLLEGRRPPRQPIDFNRSIAVPE